MPNRCKLRISRSKRVLVTLVATFLTLPAAGDESSPAPAMVLVDTSGSMDAERIKAAVEAGKLFTFLNDGSVVIGQFADGAQASPPLTLPQDWDAAAARLDALVSAVGGGTRYVAGLRVCPDNARVIVFLTDGEPSDDTEAMLYVREKVKCPIHAIAFQAGDRAFGLLSRMAAASQGAAHNVENADGLMDAFVAIHQQIRKSRRAEGKGQVPLPQVTGEVIAIGFGAEPQFNSPVLPRCHAAKLPHGTIHVARLEIPQTQDLLVTLPGSPQHKLLVLRHDLPRAFTKVEPSLNSAGGSILSRTRFVDAGGARLDPHQRGGLKVAFTLLDPQGREAQTVAGQLSPDQPEFSGSISIPTAAWAAPGWHLRTETVDEIQGAKFVESHVRALDLEQPRKLPAPASPPQPMPVPAPMPVPEDLVHLRVLAHRQAGVVMLRDPRTKSDRVALVGDKISLELSPGTALSPDEFRTLGLTLRAEFIGEDGAVRDVPLQFKDNAYRTTPVQLAFAGRLGVRVRLEIQGADVALDETVEIRDVMWRLAVNDPVRGLSQLPQYASVPYVLELVGLIDGKPANRDELTEVMVRRGILLACTRKDSGGTVLESQAVASQTLLANPEEIAATTWFKEQGVQKIRFALNDDKGVLLAEAGVQIQVVPPPLEARLQQNGGASEPWWWSWFPGCCFYTQLPSLAAVPSPSPLSTLFFVAAADVDGQPVDWKTEAVTERLTAGEHLMRVRLEQYHIARSPVGPAEIQMSIPLRSVASRRLMDFPSPLWLLPVVPAFVYGRRVFPRLRWDACRVDLTASSTSAVLATNWLAYCWPMSRLFVYRASESALGLAAGSNLPPGAGVVARIDRVGRRRLKMKFLAEMPGYSPGDMVVVDENSVVPLGDETLVAEFGDTLS